MTLNRSVTSRQVLLALSCVMTTPFGTPVVPEVKMMYAVAVSASDRDCSRVSCAADGGGKSSTAVSKCRKASPGDCVSSAAISRVLDLMTRSAPTICTMDKILESGHACDSGTYARPENNTAIHATTCASPLSNRTGTGCSRPPARRSISSA